jgi:Tfp pilus assembly protein PilF
MRLQLGELELSRRNLKGAAAHYQSVLAIDANNAVALNNLASIGGELGDPNALSYAERAMKLAPNSASVLDTYGTLLIKKGELNKGLEQLELARKLAPESNTLRLSYAKALIKTGRKDEARKELEALQAVKENFPGKEEVVGLVKGL